MGGVTVWVELEEQGGHYEAEVRLMAQLLVVV